MSRDPPCRNPNCTRRFSKTSMSASRRIPDLVNTTVLDAYYVANPAKAVNHSPDRMCPDCGRQRNVRPPTWLPDHLRVYASIKLGFTCLAFQSWFPQPRLCFSRFTFVFFVATPRLAATASDTDGMYQEPDARNMYGPRCFFFYLVCSSRLTSINCIVYFWTISPNLPLNAQQFCFAGTWLSPTRMNTVTACCVPNWRCLTPSNWPLSCRWCP